MDLGARAQTAKAAWPGFDLPLEVFLPVLERADPSGLHDADLYLACACAQRVDGALAAFERAFLSQVPLFLKRMRPSPQLVDDVQQLLRQKLFVGAAPKIAEYTGVGTLN